MLSSLEIKNFALIDYMEIDFDPGLTVLTGETGAGKSMVVDALHMVLGGKAYGEYIKSGEKKALVQAVFEPRNLPQLEELLDSMDLELEDGTLVLTRQLSRSGRNTCRVNGQVVNLQSFKQIGRQLMDMHGQHEQQSLLHTSAHLELLDRYAGPGLLEVKTRTGELFAGWQSVKQELERLQSSDRERARQADMLRYQMEEIDGAGLGPQEEEELALEKNRLVNAEKLAQLVEDGYSALYQGGYGDSAAVDQLGKAVQSLEELQQIDPEFSSLLETVSSALYQVEEAARDLASYRDNIEFQPGRLEEVENRLSEISRLKSKYGSSVQEILEYRDNASARLEELDSSKDKEAELETACAKLEKDYMEKAEQLSSARQEAAEKLKQAVESELQGLEMKEVAMEVKMTPSGPGARGLEEVEFLISTNAGEPPRPLAKIASGGELSRIMLAFKSILASVDWIPSLVFDEVDTGIGGKTLQAVARKLEELSRYRQTIVVTHAAPIAALADCHYCVYKQLQQGKTITGISLLKGENQVNELARMLGGGDTSGPVMEHARQLLQQKQN